jgi:hypothetical protein
MTFFNPAALWAGLLTIPIVIVYLREPRWRRLPIGTAWLWRQALAVEPFRAAWQRWRGPVSLAVQLTTLALLVLALADPRLGDVRLWPRLAGAAVVLLVLEWPLYQRRWLI